jgi:Uri superfamily endonuclease
MAVTGTYVLLLRADAPTSVEVGALGTAALRPGRYAYVGSAFGPGGLPARLRRHAQSTRTSLHWHVDYLRAALPLDGAWVSADDRRHECDWAQTLLNAVPQNVPLPGAGASDCDCTTHFIPLAAPNEPIAPEHIASRLTGTVRFLSPDDLQQDPIRIPTGTALAPTPDNADATDRGDQ